MPTGHQVSLTQGFHPITLGYVQGINSSVSFLWSGKGCDGNTQHKPATSTIARSKWCQCMSTRPKLTPQQPPYLSRQLRTLGLLGGLITKAETLTTPLIGEVPACLHGQQLQCGSTMSGQCSGGSSEFGSINSFWALIMNWFDPTSPDTWNYSWDCGSLDHSQGLPSQCHGSSSSSTGVAFRGWLQIGAGDDGEFNFYSDLSTGSSAQMTVGGHTFLPTRSGENCAIYFQAPHAVVAACIRYLITVHGLTRRWGIGEEFVLHIMNL